MKQKESSPLQTAGVICLALLALYVFSRREWLLLCALAVGLSSLLSPRLARLIHTFWMGLSRIAARVGPGVLLSLVFFLLLTPLAWLSRLFGPADPLRLKNEGDSMFVDAPEDQGPSSFEKTW